MSLDCNATPLPDNSVSMGGGGGAPPPSPKRKGGGGGGGVPLPMLRRAEVLEWVESYLVRVIVRKATLL